MQQQNSHSEDPHTTCRRISTHDFLYKSNITLTNSDPEISDDGSSNGSVPEIEPEEPASVVQNISDSGTDTEVEKPAPAFHAADAEVTKTDRRRRRRRNSSGPVGPLTRSRAKKIKRLSDHLVPAMSYRLAMRRLHDHNDPA